MRKKLALLAITVAAGATGIWAYEGHAARYPSTDDAYISANVVKVAPQITGAVDRVAVANHQSVTRGQLLFTVERHPFELAVTQAKASLALARQQVAEAEAAVDSAQEEVRRQQVLLENAKARAHRAHRLEKKDFVSVQTVEDAEAEYKAAQANLAVARARLFEARQRRGQPGDDNERVVQARAALDRARWDLEHTRVAAACDGQVGQLDLEAGNVVRAEQPAFVLICSDAYWVIANYKETDLEHIRPGQAAAISVDMYPGQQFQGRVVSISGASGSAFSLLPPQNASGNWVKVTQRVPVKIRVLHPSADYPLRVGTSSVVTIDTTRQLDAAAKTAERRAADRDSRS